MTPNTVAALSAALIDSLGKTALDSTGHAQGATQDDKDRADGRRDAQRVLAGTDPLWPLDRDVTPAYREGWAEAAALVEAMA